MPEGAHPVFAEGKDRLRFAVLWVGPFFFGWDDAGMFGEDFKLGFIGELRQIPSESVGAIHESPASKLGFIELLRYGNPAKITYKPVGTGVLDCPRTNG